MHTLATQCFSFFDVGDQPCQVSCLSHVMSEDDRRLAGSRQMQWGHGRRHIFNFVLGPSPKTGENRTDQIFPLPPPCFLAAHYVTRRRYPCPMECPLRGNLYWARVGMMLNNERTPAGALSPIKFELQQLQQTRSSEGILFFILRVPLLEALILLIR